MAQEFLIACQRGNLQQAKTWLDANPPLLEASEGNGFTGLILSSQGGHLPIVQLLLERGATFDRATKNGNSALACASQFGHTAVVKLLLEHNASNVNGRNVGGDTALMAAAQMGHAAVVELLIAHGADPSLQNEGGLTAFMCAAGSGKFDAFRACFQADEVCDAAEKIAATPSPSPSSTAVVEETPELAPFSISPFTAASDAQSTPVFEPVLLPAPCTHREMPAALLLNDVNGRSVLHFALAACATENADLRTIRRLMRWPQTEELWTRSTGTKQLTPLDSIPADPKLPLRRLVDAYMMLSTRHLKAQRDLLESESADKKASKKQKKKSKSPANQDDSDDEDKPQEIPEIENPNEIVIAPQVRPAVSEPAASVVALNTDTQSSEPFITVTKSKQRVQAPAKPAEPAPAKVSAPAVKSQPPAARPAPVPSVAPAVASTAAASKSSALAASTARPMQHSAVKAKPVETDDADYRVDEWRASESAFATLHPSLRAHDLAELSLRPMHLLGCELDRLSGSQLQVLEEMHAAAARAINELRWRRESEARGALEAQVRQLKQDIQRLR